MVLGEIFDPALEELRIELLLRGNLIDGLLRLTGDAPRSSHIVRSLDGKRIGKLLAESRGVLAEIGLELGGFEVLLVVGLGDGNRLDGVLLVSRAGEDADDLVVVALSN